MEYTKPNSSDPVLIAAYEEEMRRRWNERLVEWMKGQGEYELERGHHVKPLPSFMSYSYVSTEDAKIRYLCIFGLLVFIASLIYVYKDM
uniref:DUF4050 domain-containing protein n=1 Tax=Mesocestoides corti TaxID=53468 RepID=A0A5K3FCL5_MESCO